MFYSPFEVSNMGLVSTQTYPEVFRIVFSLRLTRLAYPISSQIIRVPSRNCIIKQGVSETDFQVGIASLDTKSFMLMAEKYRKSKEILEKCKHTIPQQSGLDYFRSLSMPLNRIFVYLLGKLIQITVLCYRDFD